MSKAYQLSRPAADPTDAVRRFLARSLLPEVGKSDAVEWLTRRRPDLAACEIDAIAAEAMRRWLRSRPMTFRRGRQ